jgi:hypothetical protein
MLPSVMGSIGWSKRGEAIWRSFPGGASAYPVSGCLERLGRRSDLKPVVKCLFGDDVWADLQFRRKIPNLILGQ